MSTAPAQADPASTASQPPGDPVPWLIGGGLAALVAVIAVAGLRKIEKVEAAVANALTVDVEARYPGHTEPMKESFVDLRDDADDLAFRQALGVYDPFQEQKPAPGNVYWSRNHREDARRADEAYQAKLEAEARRPYPHNVSAKLLLERMAKAKAEQKPVRELTINLERCVSTFDGVACQEHFELLLANAGYEITGTGGGDVSVRVDQPNAARAAGLIPDLKKLAEEAGLVVADVTITG